MDSDKQQALEAAGWKFGSADEFLGERPMSDSDKMRAEFELAASSENYSTAKNACGKYIDRDTDATWFFWQAAYAAGRKAEREAMQLKNWDGIRLGTSSNQEGEG